MLKKLLTTLFSVSLVFLFVLGISHAETVTSGDMYKAFDKKYKNENYDYKKNSLELHDVQTINLNEPITVKNGDKDVQVSTLQVGTAHFKTVRDYIFFKDFDEYAYYVPDQNLILTEGDVAKVSQVEAYKDKYPTEDTSLELGPIVGLSLLIIIVPFIFAYIWLKFKYNSLDFKLPNRLMEPDKKHR